jgi:POT family proton-dependent oligopeptide transporter
MAAQITEAYAIAGAGDLEHDIAHAQPLEVHSDKKDPKHISDGHVMESLFQGKADDDDDEFDYNVTEEDRINLRRVPAPIPWTCFLIAICELSERFSYYGTTQVFTE